MFLTQLKKTASSEALAAADEATACVAQLCVATLLPGRPRIFRPVQPKNLAAGEKI
jgi:hypothetical protein